MKCGEYKLELGCGYKGMDEGYIKIDKYDFSDTFSEFIQLDLEKDKLPFCTNSCVAISARNIFEHIMNFKELINECHRVLKPDYELYVEVPTWSSKKMYQDPTHCRFFDERTFLHYLSGDRMKEAYEFKPWRIKKIERKENHNDIIKVRMIPIK